MNSERLAFLLRDIIIEYRILDGSELNSVKWVQVNQDSIFPILLIGCEGGEEFKISIEQTR